MRPVYSGTGFYLRRLTAPEGACVYNSSFLKKGQVLSEKITKVLYPRFFFFFILIPIRIEQQSKFKDFPVLHVKFYLEPTKNSSCRK
jgi:hypothetical protein